MQNHARVLLALIGTMGGLDIRILATPKDWKKLK
jgi:hypothetical protein